MQDKLVMKHKQAQKLADLVRSVEEEKQKLLKALEEANKKDVENKLRSELSEMKHGQVM